MSDALVIEVVRKTVTVDCAVEEAFRVFTADAMSWWPVESHSIHGASVREIVFEPKSAARSTRSRSRASAATGRRCSSGTRRDRLVLAWNILEREGERDGGRGAVPHPRARRRGSSSSTAAGRTSSSTARRSAANYDNGWDYVLRPVRRSPLDADVDRHVGRPVAGSAPGRSWESPRGELVARRLQLRGRPPADRRQELRMQLRPGQSRRPGERPARGRGSSARPGRPSLPNSRRCRRVHTMDPSSNPSSPASSPSSRSAALLVRLPF